MRPGAPPCVDFSSVKPSKINSLVPFLNYDASQIIIRALSDLFDLIKRDNLVDFDHESMNHQIQSLLKHKFIIHSDLLTWLANAMFWCTFDSPFDIGTCARYAETFRKLCTKLKKANVSMVVDWQVMVKFLDNHYFNTTHRYLKKFEDEAIRKICKAVRKCRKFIPKAVYPEIVSAFSCFDSIEAVQKSCTMLALLVPFDSFPDCAWINDILLKWNIKHVVHAIAEILCVVSKRNPSLVHDTDVAPLMDSCIGFFELVPVGKHKRVNPFRGTLGHHCKTICSGAFEDLSVVAGSCFGHLFGHDDDLMDQLILQFLRQFELLMYPGTANRTGRENILKLMQAMFSTFAKRVDRGLVDKQRFHDVASLISVFIQRVMHEKDFQTVIFCQGLARCISFVFPDLLLQPIADFYFGAVSSCIDPRQIAVSLSIIASLSKDVLTTDYGKEILVDLFLNVANTLDSNDHIKTIATANFIETISLYTKSPDCRYLGELEADVILYLWDKLESYMGKLINHNHDDAYSTDKSLLEYIFSAFGRFFGLFPRTFGSLIEKITRFIISNNGFAIRRSFKLLILYLGRIGTPNALADMYSQVCDKLLATLPTTNVERQFKDRCCDEVIWLMHVLSSLIMVLRPLDVVDVISKLQVTALKTNNIEVARAFGKVVKSTALAFGSFYIQHYESGDVLCTLDDLNPSCWHVPTESSTSMVMSALEQMKIDSFVNFHCQAIVLFEVTKAVMHVKACLKGQAGEWASKYEGLLSELTAQHAQMSFVLFDRPNVSLDIKEVVLKVM